MTTQQPTNRRPRYERPRYEPTPDQIAETCEQIRAGWSVRETAQRITCERRISWQLPQLSVKDLTSEPEGYR